MHQLEHTYTYFCHLLLLLLLLLFVPFFSRFTQLYGSIESLKHEIEVMKEELSKFVSPVVLCHNDLQCRNILYDERDGECSLNSVL